MLQACFYKANLKVSLVRKTNQLSQLVFFFLYIVPLERYPEGLTQFCFFVDGRAKDKNEPISWRQFNECGLESRWETLCNRRSAWPVLSVCEYLVPLQMSVPLNANLGLFKEFTWFVTKKNSLYKIYCMKTYFAIFLDKHCPVDLLWPFFPFLFLTILNVCTKYTLCI